jgi:SAM-dependent methyltransferase
MGELFYKKKQDALAFGILPAYRRFELYHARYHEMRSVFQEQLSRNATLKVLDVGAGQGEAKRFMDAVAPATEWTAVEIDPKRVEVCRRLGYTHVVSEVDLEKEPLPFADGTFDIVVGSHVLEHLENADAALKDWMRVVKPGGALILGVPMHIGPIAAFSTLRYRLFGRKPRRHCHFFSMRSLRRFLRPYDVRRIWGFRFISARRQLPLEDWEWFYRASIAFGRAFPGLCAEVNVHLTKPLALP